MSFAKFVFPAYLASCVLLESGTKTAELPSVWPENYGTITYQDSVTDENGKLTKFWAQEAIGAPESKEFIAELKSRGGGLKRQDVGVIDGFGSYDKHGLKGIDASLEVKLKLCSMDRKNLCDKHGDHATNVTNLIADKSPVGVSSTGRISAITNLADYSMYKKEKLPPIINSSGTLHDQYFKEIQKDFNNFVDRTILVTTSGNGFPELPDQQVTQYSKKTIVVGSVDPTGFVSEFSQPIDDLAVLAPSDKFVTSRGIGGRLRSFSGTSGAAPQVTGALADIKSILPSLTRDEATLLLKKTSTTTAINQVSVANGAGTLNQYRALRVAKRLKDKGFPNNRQTLINDDSIYDFKNEAQKLADKAIAEPKLKLKNLRKAFFLDPDNTSIRKSLADFYQSYGFSIQSRFYDDPQKVIMSTSQQMKLRLRSFLTTAQQVKKLFNNVGAPRETLEKLNNHLGQMPIDRQLDLATLEQGGYSQKIMRTAIEAAGQLADEGIIEPLQLLIDHTKISYPQLLTESKISKIIKRHTGNLGKLKAGVKKIDMKKFIRATKVF